VKKFILALLVAPTLHATPVLQPPVTEAEWIPYWIGLRLAPFVDFTGPDTYYYEGHFSSPPFIASSSPLGTFSYSRGTLSWDVTADGFAWWVYDVLPNNGGIELFKINRPFWNQGSVEIGDSDNLAIYGKLRSDMVPDRGSTLFLFGLGLMVLCSASRSTTTGSHK
jgi:hypothetical protein